MKVCFLEHGLVRGLRRGVVGRGVAGRGVVGWGVAGGSWMSRGTPASLLASDTFERVDGIL